MDLEKNENQETDELGKSEIKIEETIENEKQTEPLSYEEKTDVHVEKLVHIIKEEEWRYAGFWLRFAAYFIDGMLMNFVGMILGFILVIPMLIFAFAMGLTEDEMAGLFTIFYIVSIPISIIIGLLYYGICESSKLQGTIGKVTVGIKVVNKDGTKITFWKAIGRAAAMTISMFTLGIGWIMIAFTDKKQSLHDIMAGCYVIKK